MKKEIKINFRVEVYPRTTLAEEEDVCISIVADINRHVNDVRFTEIVSDRAKRGSMEPIVLPSESGRKLVALAHHAILLEKWLRENSGHNEEWPVEIMADAKEGAELAGMLKSLEDSSDAFRADGECMRQLMRWQIETFGNPYGDGNEIL